MNPLECNCQWHFAKQPYASQDIGPNNAAAEHFMDSPYPSLIRESIQNSLDVVEEGKPLRMRFEFGRLRSKTYEGFYGLRTHIEGVLKLYGDKAKTEYQPMLDQFDRFFSNGQSHICYIKVSDYNTKGMDYKPDDSPFHAFVRALGLTVKENDYSGGSFGFGKSAYFMMSPIHTVLVSTKTKDNRTFFEGAANLCTHLFPDPESGRLVKYQHYGYYDNQEGKKPASRPAEIPSKFQRDEVGTDIYIMGVNGTDEKKKEAIDEMIKATLRHFWMAIMKGNLIVEIEDLTINQSSLDGLIQTHFPETLDKVRTGDNYNPRPYYECVKNAGTSKDFIHIEQKLTHLGNVSLYVWKNKEARDGVIHMRKQLMFICRSRFYSSSYGYYAVFICTDKHGNKLLKSIEDPSHRKWEPRRNRVYGKTITDEINDFISGCLQDIFVSEAGGPLGVTGLENYLFVPEELVATDRDDVEDNPFFGEPSEEVQEEGQSPISIIEPPIPTISNERKEAFGKVITVTTSRGGEQQSEGPLGGHKRGKDKKKRKGRGNAPDLSGFSHDDDATDSDFMENIPVRYRVMAEQKNGKMIHSIIIKSDFDVVRGQIEIVVGGEENDESIDIISSSQGRVQGNIVSELRLYNGISNIIELEFADHMKHAIKLTAYEFK